MSKIIPIILCVLFMACGVYLVTVSSMPIRIAGLGVFLWGLVGLVVNLRRAHEH